MNEADMQIALRLGRSFMLHSQRTSGDFHYQYNWQKGMDDGEDGGVSAVREAGAAWGMALIALDEDLLTGKVSNEVLAGTRRGLDFFDKHSKDVRGGRRIVLYPGLEDVPGDTGTLAVLALAHVDYLRTKALSEAERSKRAKHLKGLLASLQAAVRHDGRIHKHYRKDGVFMGGYSPYYDGEALLAFVKASKYLGHTEYKPVLKKMAEAGWKRNVVKGLRAGKDAKVMKGYYQWSSMAWYELLTSDQAADFSAFKKRLVDYGLWIVEVHKLEKRTRNTGYAFEGLIPAYLMARDSKRNDAMRVLGCAINGGMLRVSKMQIGHPLASSLAKKAPMLSRTKGGVQNAFEEPLLRIDTTQHQLHAVIQARRLLQGSELI